MMSLYYKECAIKLRLFSVALFLLCGITAVQSQNYAFRYVNGADGMGSFTNDGLSWENAKSNLQNAIDDLYEELQRDGSKIGYIFVTDGTYLPSRRSTGEDGSLFNTSFRIYERIYIFGGFNSLNPETPDDPDHPELLPKQRIMTNGKTYGEVEAFIDADNIGQTVRRWNFRYKTILSLHTTRATITTTRTSR